MLAISAAVPGRPGGVVAILALAALLAAIVVVLSELARAFGPLRAATNEMVAQLALAESPVDPAERSS